MVEFNRSRDAPDDTARAMVCAHLQSLGIDACEVDRGHPEEETDERELSSEGVIEVPRGPISWINVLTRGSRRRYGRLVYGVPASDLGRIGNVQIWTTRVKRLPLIGWVADVRWESYMRLPYSLRILEEDSSLKKLMARNLRQDIELRCHPGRRCWSLEVGRWRPLHLPSAGEWECYQAIAATLLRLR